MAKKKHTDPKAETAARIQRTEAYAERVRLMFTATVNQILALNKTLPKLEPGVMFSFDGQSLKKQQEVERLLRQLHSVATMAIQQGITLEWGQANAAADTLVKSMFGKEVLSSPQFSAWNNRNSVAMNAFIKRSENGLNLSQRVWQSVRQLRDEMEVAITVSLGEGQSAQKLSQSVRQYLNDPDLMFRRFRYKAGEEPEYDENGNEIGKKIIWGRKWKKRIKKPDGTYGWIDYDRDSYKTGSGVYKSSAKNAMRVARTETNIAYRRADHERWQDMDFVLGQRIQMSKDHPKKDICDKLAGDYPKDFVFDGWHPQCFCYVTPITLPPEETAKLTELMLNDEDWRAELARLKRGREITSYPENFKQWVSDNAGNIQASRERGTEPYFIRNNAQAIDNIINPPKALTPQVIAAQRHAARTPEQEEKIRNAWQERKERIEAEKKKAHINSITASYGNRMLGVMGDIPGVDTTALRAAIKAGNTELIKEEAQKLRAIGKQFKADAHSALGTAADYGEISSDALNAAIKAGNIKRIWEETKALQSQVKATQADEAALEVLIPNAHDWHKKFSSADLHATFDAVEKTFARWTWDFTTDSSLQFLKWKLEIEIDVVSKSHYVTKEVAKMAYQRRLDLVNKRIQMLTIKESINSELTFAGTTRSAELKALAIEFKTLFKDNNTSIILLHAKADTIKTKVAKLQAAAAARAAKKASTSTSKAGTSTKQNPDEYGGINVYSELDKLPDSEFIQIMNSGWSKKLGEIICGSRDIWKKFNNNLISRAEFMREVLKHNKGDFGKVDYAALPVPHVLVAALSMKITQNQKDQIRSHVGGGYIGTANSFKMNGCLRNGTKVDPYSGDKWTSDDDKTKDALDKVISGNHIKANTTLFRMVDSSWLESFAGKISEPWKIDNLENAAKTLIGKSLKNDSYTSASFTTDLNVFGSREICLRIKTPKGTNMYITENYAESEAIYGRGLTLEPIAVTRNGRFILIDCIIH